MINQYRNRGVPTDALEVKSVVEKVDSMVGQAELSVKIMQMFFQMLVFKV